MYMTSIPPSNKGEDEKDALTYKEQLLKLGRSTRGSLDGIRRVLQLVWGTNRRLTIGLGLVTLLQALLPATTIYINKLLLDTVVLAIGHTSQVSYYITIISVLAIAQLALNVCVSLFNTLTNVFQRLLQEQTSNRVLYLLIRHANTLDMAFFERSESYDKLQEVQREAMFRPATMIAGTFSLIRALIVFLSMITLLLRLQWFLALIALLSPIPAFISDSRYGWRGFQLMRHQSPARRMSAYLVHLLTTDSNHKEVKIFNLGDFFVERFRVLAERFVKESRHLIVKRYLMSIVWGILTTLVSSITFLYVAIQAVLGRITIGDLTLYTQAASSVQSNFQSLLNGVSSMYENNLYLSSLFDVLDMRSQTSVPEHPVHMQRPFTQGIEFRNVTFTYEGNEKPTLCTLSFTLPVGKTLAIVGRNGAGKTTLVKLLTRLYDPQEGQILVNGHDIREYDPFELREEIGVVFQDYIHYQLTAQENIGLGRVSSIDDHAQVEMAAHKSGADEEVAKLPRGYGTMLGRWFEEGQQLSGGQWQKIALARGFMREAQILILDEPTASLDAKTEYELFTRMRELTRGRTSILISHRFSTVRHADYIVVVENGHVIEQGTHDELMDLRGQYAEMFDLQASPYR